METLNCRDLTFVPVRGSGAVGAFRLASTPTTAAFWNYVMGAAASEKDSRLPATNMSWEDITAPGGFLDRLNALGVLHGLTARLPTEAEWEYAARGGPHAADGFVYSGSNDIGEVAWYGRKFGLTRRLLMKVAGWRIAGRMHPRTHVHAVGLKKPNQLGIYDMTGNVWEWCQDACGDGERRLRGGAHSSWDIHCTNVFRYSQPAGARGPAIGFRLAAS